MTIATIEGIRFNTSQAHLVPFYVHFKARQLGRAVRVDFPDTRRTTHACIPSDIERDLKHALMLRAQMIDS